MKIYGMDIPTTGYDSLDFMIRTSDPRLDEDKLFWHWVLYGTSRNDFDRGLRFIPTFDPVSWRMFETLSDAPDFGVWVQKRGRRILEWAAGNLSLCHYETTTAYDAALLSLCQFHEPTFGMLDPEPDTLARYYDARRDLFYDPSIIESSGD